METGIRQLGRNRWVVRVKQIEKRTGRMVDRTVTLTGSKADAIARRVALCAEVKSTATTRPRTHLHAFAASWLEARAASLKPSSSRRYKHSLEHIIPALGDIYLDAITPADVAGYVARRVAAVGVKGGHSVLNELRCLRTIAKDSVAEGYAAKDWCARVRPPAVRGYTKERPNLLTAPQFRVLIDSIPKQWRGLILFMATTGLRWGEASALHWEDVDLATGEATIRHNNDRGALVTPKNRTSYRVVPVLPDVAELWGAARASGLIFPSRTGTLHRGTPLRKVLTAACEIAKVTRVTAHGLRRTFNNIARQLTSRDVLKGITGHATDAMVEHYSIIGHDEKTAASQAAASAMGVSKERKPRTPKKSTGGRR